MKKSGYLFSLLVITFVLCSWGYKGHEVVGLIAEQHLTPQAKSSIRALLGTESLSDVSTWADDIKRDAQYRHTAAWHFLNVPSGLSYEQFAQQVYGQGADNIYAALNTQEAILKSNSASREQKTEALKFIVHLVGDAHQPMHVSHKEDKGGNNIQVRFEDKGTNLHALWDSKLIDHQGWSIQEMTSRYDKATPAQIKKLQSAKPMEWLYESYLISSRLYDEAAATKNLGDDYYNSHIDIVEQRIEQAGIRLAGVLNTIFSEAPVTAAAGETATAMANPKKSQPSTKHISLQDIAAHVGETVTVSGKVYGTKDFGSMILVNVGAAYPQNPLTVVLRGKAKSLSNNLEGKTITVSGNVSSYKEKPEIVINDPNAVTVDY